MSTGRVRKVMSSEDISRLNNPEFQGQIRDRLLPSTTNHLSLSSESVHEASESLSPVTHRLVEGSLTGSGSGLTLEHLKLIQEYRIFHPLCKRGA